MGSNTSYRVAHTVVVRHDYFTDSTCSVEVVPTPAARVTMRNHGLLFRKQDACTWLILGSTTAGSPSIPLDFEIRNHRPSFYYYSYFDDHAKPEADHSLTFVGKKGIWALMTIQTAVADESNGISVIPIRSKEKYWEVILCSKYGKLRDGLALEEEQGRLSFSEGSPVEVPGVANHALRFVSMTPISLRDRYPYRLRIIERLRQSQLTLCGVTAPQPAMLSHFDPHGSITVYCYC